MPARLPRRAMPRSLVACAFLLAVTATSPLSAQLTTLGAVQLYECLTVVDCQSHTNMGSAVATGDFDDDGFADLAVGSPFESVNGHPGAGSVHVYHGSRGGLALSGDMTFDQDTPGLSGSPEDQDHFGRALATGDFNHDGIDDLAIGIPGEDIGDVSDAGAVELLFGSAGSGLTTTGSRFFSQNTLPSPESAETNDGFGSSLAAGFQGGLGFDWLAVGVPFETAGLFDTDAGVVEILSSSAGVPLTAMDEVHQNSSCDGNPFETEAFDAFGSAVAFRRRQSGGEWVIGVPGESFLGRDFVGVVHFDGAEGCWSQDTPGVLGVAEEGDNFGSALATGDFNGDGKQDVAIGAPGETLEATSETAAGAVSVLYSDGTSLDNITASGDQSFTQDAFLPNEGAESLDLFGSSLAAGDFDGDGIDDLAIGAPHDGESGHGLAGAVGVIYGHTGAGLTANGTQQTFDEGFPAGMPGSPPQTNGDFGTALAAGDFDGNGVADLVIGAPGEQSVFVGDGNVTVLYGMRRSIGAFGTVQFSSATISVDEPTTATTHFAILTRTDSALVAASVDYSLLGGTATPGVDFTFTPGTRTWPAGNSSVKVISFDVLPDTRAEGDETIVLELSNPTPGTAVGTPSTVTITIHDDDVGGAFQLHQTAFTAGEGAGSATIQVDRVGGAASGASVHFATSNGTATAGDDYQATSTTFIFNANQTTATIQVPIFDDLTDENNETVHLTLSSPGGGATLGSPATATLTITDDDLSVLLGDGFESGTLSAWSQHLP